MPNCHLLMAEFGFRKGNDLLNTSFLLLNNVIMIVFRSFLFSYGEYLIKNNHLFVTHLWTLCIIIVKQR